MKPAAAAGGAWLETILRDTRARAAARETIGAFSSRHPDLADETLLSMAAWSRFMSRPGSDLSRYLDALHLLATSGLTPPPGAAGTPSQAQAR